jgi:hypothetical protein
MAEHNTDASLNISQDVRQMAENNITQAKQAVEKYMREANRVLQSMETSLEAAQGSTREAGQKNVSFAEQQIGAAFDFAQRLVRAKSPQEIAQLQQQFLQTQLQSLSAQAMDLGGVAAQTVKAASSRDR